MKTQFLLNLRSGTVHKVDAEGRSLEICNIDQIPERFRKLQTLKTGGVIGPSTFGSTRITVRLCRRCFPEKRAK